MCSGLARLDLKKWIQFDAQSSHTLILLSLSPSLIMFNFFSSFSGLRFVCVFDRERDNKKG